MDVNLRTETVTPLMTELLETFQNCFLHSYNNFNGGGKSKVLFYSMSYFRKWYYSILSANSTVSPADVMHLETRKLQSEYTMIEPALYPKFTGRKFSGFHIDYYKYSPSQHPIIQDLKIFLDNCYPVISLDDEDQLTNQLTKKIMKKISLYDPFYIEYLTNLAFRLKLLKIIPSIYSNHAQPVYNYEEFFTKPGEKLISIIIDKTCQISVDQLNQLLFHESKHYTKAKIYSLVQNPQTFEAFFNHVYDSISSNINWLFDSLDLESLEENISYNNMLVSTAYFLNMQLDKYIILPFGFYLKLLQPVYLKPYDFADELIYIYDDITFNERAITSPFAIFSEYKLTTLGQAFLKTNHSIDLQTNDPIDNIQELIHRNKKENLKNLQQHQTIFQLKIKYKNNKRHWKTIEVPQDIHLNQLHMELVSLFQIDLGRLFNSNHYIFITEEEKTYKGFFDLENKNNVSLKQLHLKEKNILSYYIENYPAFAMEIEVLRVIKTHTFINHTRLINQSKPNK